MSEYVVAVDIGGTSMSVAAVAPDGRILGRLEIPSPARRGGDAFVDTIAAAVADRWPVPMAVGVGTAGTVDPRTGTILAASDSFANWAGYPFRTRLVERISLPVAVCNDVDSFLIGESSFGVVKGRDNCLAVMLGTGVGGALLLNGGVVQGPRGAAGEIGHMPGFGDLPCTCGGAGHLETLAAGRCIGRRYQLASGAETRIAGALPVAEAAGAGDPVARRVLEEAGRAVGLGITITATLLDLDMAVLGGGVLGAWEWLEPGITASLKRHPLVSGASLTVARSELGSDAVLLGAAASALALVG